MTRQEYIKAIKAKLDEISPFDEPVDDNATFGDISFIAADGDARYNQVKPIISYIETELDEAARYCLSALPLVLLADDTDTESVCINVDTRGVGHVANMYEYFRLVRLACDEFDRDITAFIDSSSPRYLLQQNRYTRGGQAKPVSAYVPETAELEVYSYPASQNSSHTEGKLSYIDCRKKAENIHSYIERFIVIRAAMNVMRIIGDDNAVVRLTNEFNEALQPVQA